MTGIFIIKIMLWPEGSSEIAFASFARWHSPQIRPRNVGSQVAQCVASTAAPVDQVGESPSHSCDEVSRREVIIIDAVKRIPAQPALISEAFALSRLPDTAPVASGRIRDSTTFALRQRATHVAPSSSLRAAG